LQELEGEEAMETERDPNAKRQVFILSGQSNMSGRSGVINHPRR